MSTQVAARDEVREVSKQNAKAMNKMVNGDAGLLAAVWSQTATLTTLHPIGHGDVGNWDAIKGAFEGFAAIATDGSYELINQSIHALGDTVYETGIEHVKGKLGGHPYDFQTRVTNIYQREPAGWKMVHHHAEIVPALLEIMKKLQA